jgi:hypothetical protein
MRRVLGSTGSTGSTGSKGWVLQWMVAFILLGAVVLLSGCNPGVHKSFIQAMDDTNRAALFSGKDSELTKNLEALCGEYDAVVMVAEYPEGNELECTIIREKESARIIFSEATNGVGIMLTNNGFSQNKVSRELEGKIRAWPGVTQIGK